MPTTDKSINGWPVCADKNDPAMAWSTIAYTNRRVLLAKDAAPILLYIGQWFNRFIADIDAPPLAVWGWAYRKARQADAWSDHASGTAIDLRRDKFPIGKTNMNILQRTRIRRLLKKLDGLVIWGGDYKDARSKDEMHFAIAPKVTAAQIKAWMVKNKVTADGIMH